MKISIGTLTSMYFGFALMHFTNLKLTDLNWWLIVVPVIFGYVIDKHSDKNDK